MSRKTAKKEKVVKFFCPQCGGENLSSFYFSNPHLKGICQDCGAISSFSEIAHFTLKKISKEGKRMIMKAVQGMKSALDVIIKVY